MWREVRPERQAEVRSWPRPLLAALVNWYRMDGDEARAKARVRRQGDQPGEPAVASAWTKAGSEELEGRGLIGEGNIWRWGTADKEAKMPPRFLVW